MRQAGAEVRGAEFAFGVETQKHVNDINYESSKKLFISSIRLLYTTTIDGDTPHTTVRRHAITCASVSACAVGCGSELGRGARHATRARGSDT